MAIPFQQIIERAEQLAVSTAGDGLTSAVIDAGMTFETLFPHVLRFVALNMANDGEELADLVRLQNIVITDGVGTLPDDVIRETLDAATYPARPFVARVPYSDFLRQVFSPQLNYVSIVGSQIYFSETADVLYNGNLLMRCACLPQLPTVLTDPVPMSAKMTEEVILVLAAVMRGEIPLNQLLDK